MAKLSFNIPIENMTGALDSDHMFIQRQKHLHAPAGYITHVCQTEGYMVQNPRDYKHNPPRGAELAHLQLFGKAAKQTTELLSALKPGATPTDGQLARINDYRTRFQAQLRGNTDPQAPLDKSGHPKRYHRFDNFVRAMIFQSLKSE